MYYPQIILKDVVFGLSDMDIQEANREDWSPTVENVRRLIASRVIPEFQEQAKNELRRFWKDI